MNIDEFKLTMLSSGFILTPSGSWEKSLGAKNPRANPGEEKQQNDGDQGTEGQTSAPAVPHHQTGVPRSSEEDHGVFAVSIIVSLPDAIRRDLDGIQSSILDCLLSARRRCLDPYPAAEHSGNAVRARQRRRDRHHPKTELKPPF